MFWKGNETKEEMTKERFNGLNKKEKESYIETECKRLHEFVSTTNANEQGIQFLMCWGEEEIDGSNHQSKIQLALAAKPSWVASVVDAIFQKDRSTKEFFAKMQISQLIEKAMKEPNDKNNLDNLEAFLDSLIGDNKKKGPIGIVPRVTTDM